MDVTPPDFPSERDFSTTQFKYGELAQLGERLVCNQEVTGSSPVFSTSFSALKASAEKTSPKNVFTPLVA